MTDCLRRNAFSGDLLLSQTVHTAADIRVASTVNAQDIHGRVHTAIEAKNGFTTYTASLLNQYTQRTVPGVVDVLGAAQTGATVTVAADGGTPQATTRQGELFFRQVAVDNSGAARQVALTVTGVKNLAGPAGEDAVTAIARTAFVARTPETYGYDTDGNLVADGRWSYTWDGENRLVGMETGAAAAAAGVARRKLEFLYDGQGRRWAKKVSDWTGSAWQLASHTLFLYDGWNLLAELNALGGNAAVRTYVWGLDLGGGFQTAGGVGGLLAATGVASGTTHFAYYDGNGNVGGLVRASDGTPRARYDYGAFGETLTADGPDAAAVPFRFSSKFADEDSGLLYYGFRYYDPQTGRWPSRDPIEERGGVHLYGFCGNNAISSFDTDGLSVWNTIKDVSADAWQRTRGSIDNAFFFYDWVFEKGAGTRAYKDGDRLTELLKKSHGIQKALAEYKAQNCPSTWKGAYDTFDGFKDVFFRGGILNPSEWQVGGYNWNITKTSDASITFHIDNYASIRSFAGQPWFAQKFNQGAGWVEGVANPAITQVNQYSPWSIPSVDVPTWQKWPIHTRPQPGQPRQPTDVRFGGAIRQIFDFTMPNPCCSGQK